MGKVKKKSNLLNLDEVFYREKSDQRARVKDVHKKCEASKQKIKKDYERKGISFYFHIDAAFGGYIRSIFLDENNNFMSFDDYKLAMHKMNILNHDVQWPEKDVYESFKAFPEADSITIDPHKLGYIPYAAGAILMKDKRILNVMSYFASYIFEKIDSKAPRLGSYILEGSKAGAVSAAIWATNQLIPLNSYGYGKIIASSLQTTHVIYNTSILHKFWRCLTDSSCS